MKSTLSLLLVLLNHFFMPRHNAQLRLLKAQIAILRARIPTQRIILSPAEKAELLRIGAECGHEIDGLLEVARPATYRRWLARMRAGTPFKAVGRPRLSDHIRRFRPYLLGKWICGAGVAIVVVGRARSGGRSRPGQRDLAWRCSTRTSRWQTGPSHGFVHVRSVGEPVRVMGLEVRQGDLVHADRHGAVVVPPEAIPGLLAAIGRMQSTERLVLDPAREPGFDFAAFEAAWAAFERART